MSMFAEDAEATQSFAEVKECLCESLCNLCVLCEPDWSRS